jgi:hypothetical protein
VEITGESKLVQMRVVGQVAGREAEQEQQLQEHKVK